MKILALAAALGVSLLASGCGPIESTAVIADASVALAGAKTAEGEKYAPYEYVSAELYLEKAREERGYADFEIAIDYARKARDFARQAQAKALKAVRQGVEDAGAPAIVPLESDTPGGTVEEFIPPPPPPPPVP
jgi:hypothetical protein